MIETLQAWHSAIIGFLGFSPFLIVCVYVLSSIIKRLFRLKKKFPNSSKVWISLVVLVMSFPVAYLSDFSGTKEYLKHVVYLASISALTHQILKGSFEAIVTWVESLLFKWTGKNIDIDSGSIFKIF